MTTRTSPVKQTMITALEFEDLDSEDYGDKNEAENFSQTVMGNFHRSSLCQQTHVLNQMMIVSNKALNPDRRSAQSPEALITR